ncbi:MAG: hypothetical protein AABX11_01790 [Nanoarchaeota archaeon]
MEKKSIWLCLVVILIVLFVGGVVFKLYFIDGTEQALEKNYCNDNQREGACIQVYSPACGWFNQSIKCIKYPCAQTYGNGCQACLDKNVEYWTQGECTK